MSDKVKPQPGGGYSFLGTRFLGIMALGAGSIVAVTVASPGIAVAGAGIAVVGAGVAILGGESKEAAALRLAVAEAAKRATDAVEMAKGRAFSVGQKTALLAAVKAQTDRYDKDKAAGESVVADLTEQAKDTTALSLALAGLARRLAAVVEPDATSLSPKERDVLKKAKDAAAKALDEVTEA